MARLASIRALLSCAVAMSCGRLGYEELGLADALATDDAGTGAHAIASSAGLSVGTAPSDSDAAVVEPASSASSGAIEEMDPSEPTPDAEPPDTEAPVPTTPATSTNPSPPPPEIPVTDPDAGSPVPVNGADAGEAEPTDPTPLPPGAAWCPLLAGPWRLTTPEPMTALNTFGREAEVTVSADGLTIYYSSSDGFDVDSMFASRADWDSPFDASQRNPASQSVDDLRFIPSADGLTALLNIQDPDGDLVWLNRESTSDPWGAPVPLSVNTSNNEWDPWLSPDSLRLYFMTDRSGFGPGGKDLALVRRNDSSEEFGPLEEIVSLNSGEDEGDPSLSPDELFVVFARQGFDQEGFSDLYFATRTDRNDEFSAPQPLPLADTSSFESDPHMSAVPCELFVSLGPDPLTLDVYRTEVVAQ